MEPMKIEWVNGLDMTIECDSLLRKTEPVVRLADVDELIGTAVMHAQWLVQITDGESDENQDARAFLASPLVAYWLTRHKQEATKCGR